MEFQSLIIGLKHGQESYLISARSATEFSDFTQAASGKIGIAYSESWQFFFELSDDNLCELKDNSDYTNMLLVCAHTNRLLVPVRVIISTMDIHDHPIQNCAAQTRCATITDYFRVRKNGNKRLAQPFDLNITPEQTHHNQTQSFMVGNREFVSIGTISASESGSCMANINSQYHNGVNTENNETPVEVVRSRRTKRQAAITRGEVFPGSTTDFPSYDISPDQEPIVLRSANWVNFIKGVGQEFKGGVCEFRSKLVMYAAKIGFKFVYVRNDAVYVRAKCALHEEQSCNWFVKGAVSSVTNSFVIKEAILSHSCTLSVMGSDPQRLGCKIIGSLITDAIRAKPHISPTDLKQDFQTYYGFTIPYDKVWRGVEVARANIFGSYADSFDELRWYSQAILRTNPGSKVFLETDPATDRFQRFFLAFNASLEGFKLCRPMLFVDGTFMKTRYKGTLLAATAKDGNNGLFPVAIAIVDGENSANWYWFINKIKQHVTHEKEILFVSDRAGGLMSAFEDVYDKPLHFFCLYHLMQNLRDVYKNSMYKGKKYSDVYKNSMCKLLRDAAYAPNKVFYDAAITKFLCKGGPEAHHFLKDLPPEKWAISFAPDVHRYGELTSNAAESFNSWILEARCLPITFMIDCIRMKIMRWFTERRNQAAKWTGALTASAEEKWNEYDSVGESWNVAVTNDEGVYEVLAPTSCVVNLNQKTCSCYQWQIRGFPCAHAISVIKRSRWSIRSLVDSCFFTDTYSEIYRENIFPIPSTEKFEFIDLNGPAYIHPPVLRRQIGRQKSKRFRTDNHGKKNQQFICGRCGQYGNHYWTTCRDALED